MISVDVRARRSCLCSEVYKTESSLHSELNQYSQMRRLICTSCYECLPYNELRTHMTDLNAPIKTGQLMSSLHLSHDSRK
jgi:hypothetical protein